jgi:transposase-like protein
LELVLESERTGNASEICRREGIVPQLFYRWKQQVKQSAVEGLKQKKRGPKLGQRMLSSQESQELKQELAEVKEAFVATSMELALLKKRERSG